MKTLPFGCSSAPPALALDFSLETTTMLPSPEQLLRAAGTLMVVVGVGVMIWLLDSTVIRPWSEITGALPFWIPFLATIILGAGSLALLFFKAARRLSSRHKDSNPPNKSHR